MSLPPDGPPGVGHSLRGRHKVILGYAPGVGKTYTMLGEAHRRLLRGEDVVIGIVETHGRAETARMTDGLEQIPRKHLEYRGAMFEEMDGLAVIARRPEWVLVDELAHTNVPGARHAKRWQTVQEILSGGISVISTVNVQHLESLNDTVFEITGVRVRETLPDSIVDNADEVVLVDLTPAALMNRLRRGDVYALAKVPTALHNFFRPGNLGALRELALRKTADEVDGQLREYMEQQRIAEAWRTQERVVICVTPTPSATKLARRGYQIARRMSGVFWTIHVRRPGAMLRSGDEAALQELSELTRNLGGQMVDLEGEAVADTIVNFAVEHRATTLVLGQSCHSPLGGLMRVDVVAQVLRKARNLEVVIVAGA